MSEHRPWKLTITLSDATFYDEDGNLVADMALINSVPKLLAALEPFAYLAEVMKEGDILNFRGVYISWEQAQAAKVAIAKVEGQ